MSRTCVMHRVLQGLVLMALLLALSARARAAVGDERWDSVFGVPGVQRSDGTPGIVYAIAVDGDDVYVGGLFAMAGGKPMSSRGSEWGNIARWNQGDQQWHALGDGVSDTVYEIRVSGTDVIVGGGFVAASNAGADLTVNYIARHDRTGGQWHAYGPGVNSGVEAIEVIGSAVYIGGWFVQSGGDTVRRLATWSPAAGRWLEVGLGVGDATIGLDAVKCLQASPDGAYLYVGGEFSSVGGGLTGYENVAKFSLAAGAWNSMNGGLPGSRVNTLTLDAAGALFAGGEIYEAGGQGSMGIAKFSGSTWQPVTPLLNLRTGTVNVMNLRMTPDGALIANGVFAEGEGLARLQGGTWDLLWDHDMTVSGDASRSLAVRDLGAGQYEVYLGGWFETFGGRLANSIARWNTSSAWLPSGPALNGEVFAVHTVGSVLYVGGEFSRAGSLNVNGIVKFQDGRMASGSDLGGGVGGGVGAFTVLDLASDADANLYVAGNFTTIPDNAGGRMAGGNIARVSSAGVWNAMGGGADQAVRAVCVRGDLVFAGGSFQNIGGIPADRVAVWNRTSSTWSAMGTGIGAGGAVYALATRGDDVFVGGFFTTAGGAPVRGLARWNLSSNQWFDLGGGVTATESLGNAGVMALKVVGDVLYVGGYFDHVGANVPAYQVAAYNLITSTWTSLGGRFGYGPSAASFVDAIEFRTPYLYVAGFFDESAPGVLGKGVARLHTQTGEWSAVGPAPQESDPQMRGRCLLSTGGDLYIGGWGNELGGARVSHFARFQEGAWVSLGSGPDGYVSTLTSTASGRVFVGGRFSSVGGIRVSNAAVWSEATRSWFTLGIGLQNGVGEGQPSAFFELADRLWIGGDFNRAGNAQVQAAASYSYVDLSWSALPNGGIAGTGLPGHLPPLVSDFSLHAGEVYASGLFTHAGGVECTNIARYSFSTGQWAPVDSGIPPANGSVWVHDLAPHGTQLFAGGSFAQVGSVAASNIASWLGWAWEQPGGGLGGTVSALVSTAYGLYAGGDFVTAGGNPASRIARWNDTAWEPLGGGVNQSVSGVAATAHKLYAVGLFTEAGGIPASCVARWDMARASWAALGSGLTEAPPGFTAVPFAQSIAQTGGVLFVGGSFLKAGGNPSAFLARYVADLPPLARPDSYEMDQGATLSLTAPGLLANDADPESDTLTIGSFQSPTSGGYSAIWPDGRWVFTPPADFHGVTTANYTVTDGINESALAEITVTVRRVNHAPVAEADEYTVAQGATLDIASPGVLENDTDLDGDSLTVELFNPPGYGTLTLHADGSFVYVAPSDYSGDVLATYRVFDGTAYTPPTDIVFHVTPVTHSISLCAQSGVPVAIPDGESFATYDFVVAESATIRSMTVGMTVDHTQVSDLVVTLTHVETNRFVTLFSLSGCTGDNIDVFFDDTSGWKLTDFCGDPAVVPVVNGSVQPVMSLGIFQGEDAAGTWRMRFSDTAAGETGQFSGGCLIFDVEGPAPTATPTPTATATVTATESPSPSPSPTEAPTNAPTETPSPTVTATATATDEPSATPSPTPLATKSPTATLTETPTDTPPPTDTPEPSATPSSTPAVTRTPTASPTAPSTPSPSPTLTVSPSPTATAPSDSDGDGYSDDFETQEGSDPASPGSHPMIADVDGDGRVTTLDAIRLYRALRTGDSTGLQLKDLNGDGQIDVADAIHLYRWLIGDPAHAVLR